MLPYDQLTVIITYFELDKIQWMPGWTQTPADEFDRDIRERQSFYTSQGVTSVPAVIVNDKHLISGAQPADVFVQALSQIVAKA